LMDEYVIVNEYAIVFIFIFLSSIFVGEDICLH